MCCFSGEVTGVTGTRIFARGIEVRDHLDRVDRGYQALIYSMDYATDSDVAMVLPLPVPPGSLEAAVSFVNLEGYANLFADMQWGFATEEEELGRLESFAAGDLAVHEVGAFEASFVPSIDDFVRLDPRFRLSAKVWTQRPSYADYGFAVFNLKATGQNARHVHPLAFVFPRRDAQSLFFPTLHVHDGVLHSHAEFDHVLYCQPGASEAEHLSGWERSRRSAADFMRVSDVEGLVRSDAHVWRLPLTGHFENRDCTVGPGGWTPIVGAA